MMKKIVLLSIVIGVVLLAGCVERTAKIGCCAKDNISDGCMLLNMTTSELEDYISETEWCNETSGLCNVSIGDKHYLVPVCTDAELNECINPECTAMICGDFMFKPKIAPGVVSPEGSEGAQVDVPPEQEEEEARIGFYKAQCKFMGMDNKLASLMKNTDSDINVFRFGVGGTFEDFERYRYFFPMSDKYCNVFPDVYGFTGEKVDRYMNYLGVSGSSTHVAFDPENLPECIDDTSTGGVWLPFRYGLQDYPDNPNCAELSTTRDRSEYSFELFCPHIYQIEYGTERYLSPDRRIDDAFYRMGLSIAHAETIYDETTSRAPFECLYATDCYSGTCNTDYYSRSVNIVIGGSEVTTDCYVAENAYDQPVVACASTTDVDVDPAAEDPPDFDYASIPVNLARIRVRVDSYPGSAFSSEPDPPDDYDVDNCEGGDNVCELVTQWRDFSGLDLGKEVDGDSKGYLDYELGSQVVSDDFTIENLPIDFGFEDSDDCELLGGADTSNCPYITYEDSYPPAGGIVFFGSDSSNPVIWEDAGTEYEIIGYAIAPHSPEFYDYLFVDRCSREYAFEIPLPVYEGGDAFTCNPTCTYMCSLSGDPATFEECSDYCHVEGTEFPCEITEPIVEALPFAEDLIPVEVGPPDGANWQKLMDAFEPLYMERLDRLQKLNWEDGCGKRMDAPDVIISSLPWVLEFKKNNGNKRFTSSEAAGVLYNYNIYNSHAIPRSTDLCDMRYDGKHDDDVRYNYWLLYANEIWLIKKPVDNSLGNCEVDVNGLPKMNTYGWCEPCTGSTIAYQEVNAMDPYVPEYELQVPHEYSGTGSGLLSTQVQTCSLDDDEITCDAWWITDVEELNGNIEETGSPRTIPTATVLKERIGNYLKSGILPVLDMSNDNNWEKFDYTEYAFEDVYGNMGAVVVIVDTINMDDGEVSTIASSAVRDRIAERTGIIKSSCPRCMPAIQVWHAPDNETLDELLSALFSDNRLKLDIDIVGYWYLPIGYEYEGRYEGESDEELADSTVEDMLSFSQTILRHGKASLITRFAVFETADVWTEENSEVLFNRIVDRSGEFANSGTIGIIYSPARTTFSYDSSGAIVDASGGQGLKGEKFCNLQESLNRYLSPPPTTIFSPIAAFESVNCTNCTSVDYLAGTCSPVCANGELCDMPAGVTSGMKCPVGAIVEPCRLCNETPGTYSCEYRYANGSDEVREYDYSLVSSDAFMDVMGGLDEKCCIEGDAGNRYSYSKQTITNLRNIPIVFSKTGNTDIDCGAIGYSGDMFSSAYCGIEVVPVKNYEVECEFIPD